MDAPERLTKLISLLRRPAANLPESLTDAAYQGSVECMALFLERGANLEQRSAGFASPLTAACSAGQLESCLWLIEKGASLDPAEAQMGPIQAALSLGRCDVADLLLKAGLPVEKAAWGVAAAASSNHTAMLGWLLGQGIDLDKSYAGLGLLRERAVKNAQKSGHHQLAEQLQDSSRDWPAPAAPPVRPKAESEPIATSSERESLVAEALAIVQSAGPEAANWPSAKRDSVLAAAAKHGAAEVVQALLEIGADPNWSAAGTPTALYRAAESGHASLVQLLLYHKASPNGTDGKTWLPLLGAVLSGQPETVQLLLTAGAKPRAKPAGGGTLVQNVRGPYVKEILDLLATPVKKGTKSAKS